MVAARRPTPRPRSAFRCSNEQRSGPSPPGDGPTAVTKSTTNTRSDFGDQPTRLPRGFDHGRCGRSVWRVGNGVLPCSLIRLSLAHPRSLPLRLAARRPVEAHRRRDSPPRFSISRLARGAGRTGHRAERAASQRRGADTRRGSSAEAAAGRSSVVHAGLRNVWMPASADDKSTVDDTRLGCGKT